MTKPGREHGWKRYLDFVGKQWLGRKTRLGIFEPDRKAMQDYWIECGLPLEGIELDESHDRPAVYVKLRTLGHEVREPVRISFHLSKSGDEDGVDILDAAGRMTVLRFESDQAVA